MGAKNNSWIDGLPKAELHVHIEGTLSPELIFKLAQRNSVKLKYNSVEALRSAYNFNNLQEFLDIYYEGASVLLKENDFYEMTISYLRSLSNQSVLHCELFFDPQTHTDRGIAFSTVIKGILRAMEDAKKEFNISSHLIMCFLRHLSEEEALVTLEQAKPYRNHILGVGLDSSEMGHPPSKFKGVFDEARSQGYLSFAHAGEEGPVEYIWEAIDLLKVQRIDHGNKCVDDENLLQYLAKEKIPLTMCPVSNIELCVIDDLKEYPLRQLLDRDIIVTINSDDPAYFKGSLNDNYNRLAKSLQLSKEELYKLALNSLKASILPEDTKGLYISKLNSYATLNN